MAYSDIEDRKAYHRNWYAQNKSQRVRQIMVCQEREGKKLLVYKRLNRVEFAVIPMLESFGVSSH